VRCKIEAVLELTGPRRIGSEDVRYLSRLTVRVLDDVAPLSGRPAVQIFDDFHVTHEMSVKTIGKVIEAHKVSSANLAEAGYERHPGSLRPRDALRGVFYRRTSTTGPTNGAESLENRDAFPNRVLACRTRGRGA